MPTNGYLGIGRTLFCALRFMMRRASMVAVNAESEYLSTGSKPNDTSKRNKQTM